MAAVLAEPTNATNPTNAAGTAGTAGDGFDALTESLWTFLSAPEQRPMVRLTYEAFLLSLTHDPGPWAGFAAEAARDWLDLLVRAQPPGTPPTLAETRATRALALIRGLLLDLLACGDDDRVRAAAGSDWQRRADDGREIPYDVSRRRAGPLSDSSPTPANVTPAPTPPPAPERSAPETPPR